MIFTKYTSQNFNIHIISRTEQTKLLIKLKYIFLLKCSLRICKNLYITDEGDLMQIWHEIESLINLRKFLMVFFL